MAQGKKDNQNEEKKRSFVREHIVPRKNTKKIILTILSTIGLALLFGAIAGVAFFVSQDILDGNTVTQAPPTISISPDDHGPNNTDPFFPEQSSSVPERDSAESTTETKEAESSDLFPGGETSPDPDEGTSEGSGETDTKETTGEPEGSTDPSDSEKAETDTPAETPEETETETDAPTILDVYKKIRSGFVGITISTPEGSDIFGNPVYATRNTFGAVITETEESYYVLFDGSALTDDGFAAAYLDASILESEYLGKDELTGIAALRLSKNEQTSALSVIPLGNSNLTLTADTVYQFGYQMGDFIAMDQGVVSYISSYENFVDGYRMLIYTGMQRKPGTFSILVNQSAEIIGLISDHVSVEGNMAAARGISSVKYMINDLCSGIDTAYIGLQGRAVGSEGAAQSGRPIGFYIQSLDENGPAYRSGLQPGDRILSFNGQQIPHSFGLQLQIDELSPGSEVRIQIARRGGDGSEMILLYRFLAGAR